MANHLIIGLGGTGGKVLREMRKRVYEEFRSNDPGNGVFLDYVYVDSSYRLECVGKKCPSGSGAEGEYQRYQHGGIE